MTNPLAEPKYELSTYRALPIPDYLVPPNVKVVHDTVGGHIVFDSKLKPEELFMTSEFSERVQKFLLGAHSNELSKSPEKLQKLTELYSANLAATFMILEALYDQQAGLFKNGHWDDAADMNLPDKPFSIPREVERLSLQSFLTRHIAKHLSKLNPMYRKMSATEENSALTVSSGEPNVIQVDISDPATFAMMQSNGQLEENFEQKLKGLSETELLNLFLLPEDEQRHKSSELVSSILSSENHEKLSPLDFAISKMVEGMFHTGGAVKSDIERDDFRNYGRPATDIFTPYWRENEEFEKFAKRELGLDRKDNEIVLESIDLQLLQTKVPISESGQLKLDTLATQLFSHDELQQLLTHAILIEDDGLHELALAMEEAGMIEAGKVPRVTSPIEGLREKSEDQRNDFYFAIFEKADAVYGAPNYFPKPSTDTELIADIKSIDVIPQDPKLVSLMDRQDMVWGATVRGEATDLGRQTPMRSVLGSIDLVVLDIQGNEQLTDKLLDSRDLLRYMIGAKLIDVQREKMKDLKYIFRMVEERKIVDGENGQWPFDEPAKKPE